MFTQLSSRPESQRSVLARGGGIVATMLRPGNHWKQQSLSFFASCYLIAAICYPPLLAFSLSTSSTLHIQILFAQHQRIHLRSVRRVDGQKAKKNRHRARPSR